jgi:hypothetical protein
MPWLQHRCDGPHTDNNPDEITGCDAMLRDWERLSKPLRAYLCDGGRI